MRMRLRRAWARTRALFRRRRLEREMEEELRLHLELEAEDNVRRGLSPEDARRAAAISFGGLDRAREECRDSWGHRALETLLQDLRYGARSLRRNPGYAAAVLVTLALGIGANTAVFSVVNAVLLKPLPYARGDEVVVLRQPERTTGSGDIGFSVQELKDYGEQATSLESVVEYHSMNFTLLGGVEPQRVRTGVVSASFFDVLQVKPLLGRTFRPGEDRDGAEPVLVLSHDYWRSLGSDPGIVGRRFEMNDRVHTVVGVLPPLPEYPDDNDVYMPSSACPFRSRAATVENRRARMLQAFGRVKPGVSLQRAQADLDTVAARLRAAYPDSLFPGADTRTVLSPLQEDLVKEARPTFLVLLGTVALVLLIACANVANLALARLAGRSRELAVRAALGAGRRRLLRQLATESTLLAIGGGVLGLVFAVATRDSLTSFAARFTARAQEIEIDGTVLAFTLALALVTGLLAGTLPGLPPGERLARALLESSTRSAGSRGRSRLRSSLVTWQLALSFVLLIGAALMLRSFAKLRQVDPGFRDENVLTLALHLNFSRFTIAEHGIDVERTLAYLAGLDAEASALPGVLQVAHAWTFPLNSAFHNDNTFEIEGHDEGAARRTATFVGVSPDYFEAIGVPLIRGRFFDAHDRGPERKPVIVSRRLAARHFADVDPLGRRISFDGGTTWRTIVGVVGDVRQAGLDREPADAVYLPFLQFPGFSHTLFVRTAGDPMRVAAQVRQAAHRLDADTAVSSVRSLTQIRSESLSQPRLTTLLLGLFAFVALAISAAGLSGLIAYSVSERTQEIGIRLALGAEPGRVLAMLLGQALQSVAVGLGLGLVGALGLSRLVSRLLFGIEPTDPLCFVGSALVLIAVAIAACLIPARRATSIQPTEALRVG
jgi:putative ABC transport system permease protein